MTETSAVRPTLENFRRAPRPRDLLLQPATEAKRRSSRFVQDAHAHPSPYRAPPSPLLGLNGSSARRRWDDARCHAPPPRSAMSVPSVTPARGMTRLSARFAVGNYRATRPRRADRPSTPYCRPSIAARLTRPRPEARIWLELCAAAQRTSAPRRAWSPARGSRATAVASGAPPKAKPARGNLPRGGAR